MEVYTRPHDDSRPLVCLDETSKQLVGETRTPIPMKPGQPARYDYEYKRGGTQSLFMCSPRLKAGAGWRSKTSAQQKITLVFSKT